MAEAVSGPSMLQPMVPISAGLPSASTAQQRAAPALHPDWQQGSLQQQHSGQQQMYAALRQRQAQAQPTGQHPVGELEGRVYQALLPVYAPLQELQSPAVMLSSS